MTIMMFCKSGTYRRQRLLLYLFHLLWIFMIPTITGLTYGSFPEIECETSADFIFLVIHDGTNSDSFENKVKPFLKRLSRKIEIRPQRARLALISEVDNNIVGWSFDDPLGSTNEQVIQGISQTKLSGNTKTNVQNVFKKANDMIESRLDLNYFRHVVMLVITNVNDNTFPQEVYDILDNIKNDDATVGSVGIVGSGSYIENQSESPCNKIVSCTDISCPPCYIATFDALNEIVDYFANEFCKFVIQEEECTAWSNWSKCNVSCGIGKQERTRSPLTNRTQEEAHKLNPFMWTCEQQQLSYTKTCDTEIPCNQKTTTCEYEEWSNCSTTCGTSYRKRTSRDANCAEKIEKCSVPLCPIDAVVGPWEEWSSCTPECGNNRSSSRRRSILSREMHGGRSLEEQKVVMEEHKNCQSIQCISKESQPNSKNPSKHSETRSSKHVSQQPIISDESINGNPTKQESPNEPTPDSPTHEQKNHEIPIDNLDSRIKVPDKLPVDNIQKVIPENIPTKVDINSINRTALKSKIEDVKEFYYSNHSKDHKKIYEMIFNMINSNSIPTIRYDTYWIIFTYILILFSSIAII